MSLHRSVWPFTADHATQFLTRVVTSSAEVCSDVSAVKLGSTHARLNLWQHAWEKHHRPSSSILQASDCSEASAAEAQRLRTVWRAPRPELTTWLQLSTFCAVGTSPSTHEANSAGPGLSGEGTAEGTAHICCVGRTGAASLPLDYVTGVDV